MALLAEQLVEEWLNRNGYFTIRGMKLGVDEIDLLAIKPTPNGIDARHVEVQISFRPISYIGKLTKQEQKKLGFKSANSAGHRPDQIVKAGIAAWVEKKFTSSKKLKMRDMVLSGGKWRYQLVHAAVKFPDELRYIRGQGIQCIPFRSIVDELCAAKHEFSMGAGTDLAEIVRYCPQPVKKKPKSGIIGSLKNKEQLKKRQAG